MAAATLEAPELDHQGRRLDRPFDPAIWRDAKRLAVQYQLVLAREETVGYLGRTVEMPYVMGDGRTIEKCVAETLEATTLVVATCLEKGERPPSPASHSLREVQLNIRLTADEKLRMETAARQAGFRSLADFVRTAALERSR